MSELGSGSGSSYPGSLDTDSTLEINSPNAGKTKARAEVPNDLAAAIIAVQTELGTDPAGTATNVKTFLQAEHATDGTHTDITVDTINTFPVSATPAADTVVVSNGAGKLNAGWIDVGLIALSYTEVLTHLTGTAQIPLDDTIPQITEGTEFMTIAHTALSATSKIIIEYFFVGTLSGTGGVISSLFKDSGVDALSTNWTQNTLAGFGLINLYGSTQIVAGDTSAHTYRLRVGPTAAITVGMNGSSSARLLGGAIKSFMRVTEIEI